MARAVEDIKRYTTDENSFAIPVLFSCTSGNTITTATCNAIAIKHNLVVDETTGNIRTGIPMNGRSVRVSVSEIALNALSYPVRNTDNVVDLIGHLATFTDVSGVQSTYQIREQFPDESTGLIVCFLGDYGTATPPGRLIIGWKAFTINVAVVTTPDGSTQTLDNGDIIPVQYALNNDGTLTINYLNDYNLNILSPIMMDNMSSTMDYNRQTGTFDNTTNGNGGFLVDVNILQINVVIPLWKQ